ncbi:ATP-binding protein [Candidatus Fukatsuia endosymbiont of Tuberolachnus salignus]|uniref:ATP-binding protein n=1 Tax=Candidatus Fukatsuia endosymbiont of Tuberolachnus salignus TaxID=3077957 RepID=UPI00313B2359
MAPPSNGFLATASPKKTTAPRYFRRGWKGNVMNVIEKIENSRQQQDLTFLEDRLKSARAPLKEIAGVRVDVAEVLCPQHGAFEQRCRTLQGFANVQQKTDCPACLHEKITVLKKNIASDQQRNQAQLIKNLLSQTGIPARFTTASFESYQPINAESLRCQKVCQAYAQKWHERLAQGGGLVMCGKPGTGKNHLAVAIAKHIITTHHASVVLTSALRITREVKSTWAKDATQTESEVIKHYTGVDMLIIDEIGVQFGSEAEKLILFEIINTRYENMKPTLLLSNLPKEDLTTYLGERVLDRMNEGGGCTLAFTWESYRVRTA